MQVAAFQCCEADGAEAVPQTHGAHACDPGTAVKNQVALCEGPLAFKPWCEPPAPLPHTIITLKYFIYTDFLQDTPGLLPDIVLLPAGGAAPPIRKNAPKTPGVWCALTSTPALKNMLRALEVSLQDERRAQQEMVYLMSARVLDAVQWCTVAAALYPLHCDLEPLLCTIAALSPCEDVSNRFG